MNDLPPLSASERAGAIARNLTRVGLRGAARVRNVTRKEMRGWGKHTARALKIVVLGARDGVVAVRKLGRTAVKRASNIRKPFIRGWRRSVRATQLAQARWAEWRVEREIRQIARSHSVIVVGPWLSEVGFEVMYWLPFVRWFVRQYNLAPDRLVAVSRGGVRSWYLPLASRYGEVFDYLDPDTFAVRNETRRVESDGSRKQMQLSALDREVLEGVQRQFQLDRVEVLHPSLMYQLFKRYWLGQRGYDSIQWFTRCERPTGPFEPVPGLPPRYVAVKLYAAASLADSPETRATLRSLLSALAERLPVVLLDTGLTLDDHDEFVFKDDPRFLTLRDRMAPSTNLDLQSRVIAHAHLFVGTCGSLTWLAPQLGVPTIALFSDDRFLGPHLYVARQVYRSIGAAPFMTVDVRALSADRLDLWLAPMQNASRAPLTW